MTNIPTDLLRTLISVVDLRSFTKAANSLGVTQPAVSAQIKRLQLLLGSDLLDKSAPGVSLTPAGELVVNYARRLLSINDQILDLTAPHPAQQTLRVGCTGDSIVGGVAEAVARFRTCKPHRRFVMSHGSLDDQMRELREGQLDVLVWLSNTQPTVDARHVWTEELVWVRSPLTRIDDALPVPLVCYGETCLLTGACVAALNAAGIDSELAFTGPSIGGLAAAVAAGIGVSALPRGSAVMAGLQVWENPPLPRLRNVHCGISVRSGGDSAEREQLADVLAEVLKPQAPTLSEGPAIDLPLAATAPAE